MKPAIRQIHSARQRRGSAAVAVPSGAVPSGAVPSDAAPFDAVPSGVGPFDAVTERTLIAGGPYQSVVLL